MVVYPPTPPSSDEPVEMSKDVVDRMFAQLDALQARVDHVIEKQTQQEYHLTEQDRQRGVMWGRVDDVAASQQKTLKLAEDTAESVGTMEGTLKDNIRGMELATRVRKFLIWVGGITIAGLLTAGAGMLVTWLVSHWSELFRRG